MSVKDSTVCSQKPQNNPNFGKIFESAIISSEKHKKILNISDQFIGIEDIDSNKNQIKSRITGFINKLES